MHSFPKYYHEFGCLKEKFILSKFWRPEVQKKASAEHNPCGGLWEEASLASFGHWWPLRFLVLWLHLASLSLRLLVAPLPVCV